MLFPGEYILIEDDYRQPSLRQTERGRDGNRVRETGNPTSTCSQLKRKVQVPVYNHQFITIVKLSLELLIHYSVQPPPHHRQIYFINGNSASQQHPFHFHVHFGRFFDAPDFILYVPTTAPQDDDDDGKPRIKIYKK